MSFRPRATVHLPHIVANWQAIDQLHPGATTAAVVKANGYGLGALRVSETLSKAGCSTFFVAHIEEGVMVRKTLGAAPRIFVLNGPAARDFRSYHEVRADTCPFQCGSSGSLDPQRHRPVRAAL